MLELWPARMRTNESPHMKNPAQDATDITLSKGWGPLVSTKKIFHAVKWFILTIPLNPVNPMCTELEAPPLKTAIQVSYVWLRREDRCSCLWVLRQSQGLHLQESWCTFLGRKRNFKGLSAIRSFFFTIKPQESPMGTSSSNTAWHMEHCQASDCTGVGDSNLKHLPTRSWSVQSSLFSFYVAMVHSPRKLIWTVQWNLCSRVVGRCSVCLLQH